MLAPKIGREIIDHVVSVKIDSAQERHWCEIQAVVCYGVMETFDLLLTSNPRKFHGHPYIQAAWSHLDNYLPPILYRIN